MFFRTSPGYIPDQISPANNNLAFPINTNWRTTNVGLPMAALPVQNPTTNALHFTGTSFTISGWYYSCATTSYTVFCKKDVTQSPQQIYLCLEIDSDSNFVIQIRLSSTQYSHKISSFQALTGWNYFAISVQDVFKIATITFYASNDQYTGLTSAAPFLSESFVIYGQFGTDPTSANNILSMGCQYDGLGNCNKPLIGYFNSLKIWSNSALSSNNLLAEVVLSSSCTGSCNICPILDSQCLSSKSMTIVTLDLEQNAQALTDSITASTVFYQGSSITAGSSDGDPIRIPLQGMRFSPTSFITSSTVFQLPHGLFVEAWIKLDLKNIVTTGNLQYIYQAVRNTNTFSIAIDYNLISVNINQAQANYFINWKASTAWRYVGVMFMRSSYDSQSYMGLQVGTSQVKIYVDNSLVSTQTIPAVFVDDQTSTMSDTVGRNFQGVIRKFKISANMMCNLGTPSTSVSTSCLANGATTSCNICDSSTSTCFSSCGLNTIDNQCTSCNWKCRTCFVDVNTCTACETNSFLVGTAPTCTCAAGYVQINNSCQACNNNCATCLDITNTNCPVCSATAFLYAGKSCIQSCPYGYLANPSSNLCHFDTTQLIDPVYQLSYMNQGCSYNQYATGSVCSSCNSNCYTCQGGSSTDCTSCMLGKYLSGNQCLTCDATGMIIGSSGECVEICGDGKNFGLVDCDDGNLVSGDGCDSTCSIEQDWICSGGSSTTPDVCQVSQIYIESLVTTDDNNILIQFSKPAYIVDDLSTDDLEIQIQKYDGTMLTNFDAVFSNLQEMPSQTLFVQLFINEFLQGENRQSKVTIIYKRSQKIFDTQLNELLTYTEAFTYIDKVFPDLSQQEKNAIKGMGMLNNLLIIIVIGFTTFLAYKFDSSLQPAFLIFFGMQEVLYTLLFSFEYPYDMNFFWKYYSWVQLEFREMIPNTFSQYFMDMNQIQQGSYTENYQFISKNSSNQIRFGIDLSADSFIINNHLKIFVWFFYISLFIVFWILKKKLAYKKRESIKNAFMFSSTISLFMCCLMPFGQASFIEIQNIKKTLPFKIASVSSSFFMLATMFFFLYSITLVTIQGGYHYHNEAFLKKYLSLLKPFKSKQACLLYYPIFSWKRFIQIIITALFIDTPVLQAFAVAILQLGFLIYVFTVRPFQSTYNNVLSIISQFFPFILSLYSLSFNGSTNDPQKAFNFGWGSILIVSVYCLTYSSIAIVANIYHILEKAAFAQRYSHEIEDLSKLTLLSLLHKKTAAQQEKEKNQEDVDKFLDEGESEQFKIPQHEPGEEQEAEPEEQEEDILAKYLQDPANKQPLIFQNQFSGPLGINNSGGKNVDYLFNNSSKSQQKGLPPIDAHKTKFDPKMFVTPTETNKLFNGRLPQDDYGEDLSDNEGVPEAGVDLANSEMNITSKSKKKTKKVKKKVKSKKKKTNYLGETVKNDGGANGSIDGKNKGEYVLL